MCRAESSADSEHCFSRFIGLIELRRNMKSRGDLGVWDIGNFRISFDSLTNLPTEIAERIALDLVIYLFIYLFRNVKMSNEMFTDQRYTTSVIGRMSNGSWRDIKAMAIVNLCVWDAFVKLLEDRWRTSVELIIIQRKAYRRSTENYPTMPKLLSAITKVGALLMYNAL